ncbi:MAG TPA: hypothetical protein P5218_10055, partial [Planctomycetota bacterium]|nr:hypothetical protein [Planctomycetota bacterium]
MFWFSPGTIGHRDPHGDPHRRGGGGPRPDYFDTGLSIFLVSLSVVFAAAIVGYWKVRSASETWVSPWQTKTVVLVGVASVLLISVDMALVVARRREWNVDARRWLFGAVLALGGYLLVQGMLWVELTDRIHAQRRVELATLSILLALHALHAVGGLVALGWTFWNLGQASASPRTRSTPLERLSRYA